MYSTELVVNCCIHEHVHASDITVFMCGIFELYWLNQHTQSYPSLITPSDLSPSKIVAIIIVNKSFIIAVSLMSHWNTILIYYYLKVDMAGKQTLFLSGLTQVVTHNGPKCIFPQTDFLLSDLNPFGPVTFGKYRRTVWLCYFISLMCVGSQQEVSQQIEKNSMTYGPRCRSVRKPAEVLNEQLW